jgi:hypothetical protein
METVIKKGFFSGAAVIAIYSIAYTIQPTFYFEFGFGFATFLVNLGFMAWAVQTKKSESNGLISFSEALKISFLVIVISNLLFYIYDYLMNNMIAPELPILAKEFALERVMHLSEMFGADLDEDTVHAIEKSFDEHQGQSLGRSFFSFLQSLIGGFGGSALVAIFLKNKSNESTTWG